MNSVMLYHGHLQVRLVLKVLKKSTPFAAQMASETASKAAMEHGLKSVEVTVKALAQVVSQRSVRYNQQV